LETAEKAELEDYWFSQRSGKSEKPEKTNKAVKPLFTGLHRFLVEKLHISVNCK